MIHRLLQYLIWFVVKTLVSTYRIERRGLENKEKVKAINPKGSFVFAVWHEQVVSVMSCHAWTEPYLATSSRSKDGDYAAFVSVKMGFTAVRGSSRKRGVDKGGKEVIQQYIEKLNEGISGGLTVDGPKGPRQVCKPGIAIIAQASGAPILPTAAIASSYWEFNSWDKFKLPKPFAKITLLYGEPIPVKPENTPEEIELVCTQVGDSLKSLTKFLENNP